MERQEKATEPHEQILNIKEVLQVIIDQLDIMDGKLSTSSFLLQRGESMEYIYQLILAVNTVETLKSRAGFDSAIDNLYKLVSLINEHRDDILPIKRYGLSEIVDKETGEVMAITRKAYLYSDSNIKYLITELINDNTQPVTYWK